jgi:hypothetical protein
MQYQGYLKINHDISYRVVLICECWLSWYFMFATSLVHCPIIYTAQICQNWQEFFLSFHSETTFWQVSALPQDLQALDTGQIMCLMQGSSNWCRQFVPIISSFEEAVISISSGSFSLPAPSWSLFHVSFSACGSIIAGSWLFYFKGIEAPDLPPVAYQRFICHIIDAHRHTVQSSQFAQSARSF